MSDAIDPCFDRLLAEYLATLSGEDRAIFLKHRGLAAQSTVPARPLTRPVPIADFGRIDLPEPSDPSDD